jgi:hypothetical protein
MMTMTIAMKILERQHAEALDLIMILMIGMRSLALKTN